MKSLPSDKKVHKTTSASVVPSAANQDSPVDRKTGNAVGARSLSEKAKEGFGTSNEDLIVRLFGQVMYADPRADLTKGRDASAILAILRGIHAKDELESLLAAQIAATHNLAMEFLRQASLREQTTFGIDVNVNRATKLLRCFTAQVEALHRYRGKGEQKMVVEHVHVHNGGQALVGQVNNSDRPGDDKYAVEKRSEKQFG